MRKKLTAEQKYQQEYYQTHKGEKSFEARRTLNNKRYHAKPATKRRRNAKLRERWANDPEYRRKIGEYQKAWRRKRKLAAASAAKKLIKRK